MGERTNKRKHNLKMYFEYKIIVIQSNFVLYFIILFFLFQALFFFIEYFYMGGKISYFPMNTQMRSHHKKLYIVSLKMNSRLGNSIICGILHRFKSQILKKKKYRQKSGMIIRNDCKV